MFINLKHKFMSLSIADTAAGISQWIMFVGAFNWLVAGAFLLRPENQMVSTCDDVFVIFDDTERRFYVSVFVYLLVGFSGIFWLVRRISVLCCTPRLSVTTTSN